MKIYQRLTVLRVIYKSKPQKVDCFKSDLQVKATKSCIIFLITVPFFFTSVQVILVPYCCLFGVLSNDILKVYRHIFLEDTCTNIKVTTPPLLHSHYPCVLGYQISDLCVSSQISLLRYPRGIMLLLLKSYKAPYLNTSQNHTQFEAYPNAAPYNFLITQLLVNTV